MQSTPLSSRPPASTSRSQLGPLLALDGSSDSPATSPIGGDTVLRARDLDAAVNLVTNHPFIARGGTLQVSSISAHSDRSAGDKLDGIAYRHLLVAYDGTSEGDEAVIAADLLAQRDHARLTIVVLVELEQRVLAATRLPRGRGVWNDVLLDRARADLQRARRLIESPAELTVLFGPARRAVPEGASEFDCDAIMLPPRPRGRIRRLLSRDQADAIRRSAPCQVLRPR